MIDELRWKADPHPVHYCEPPDNFRHPVWRGIMGGTMAHFNEVWRCPVDGQKWWCEPCGDGVLRWKRTTALGIWWRRNRTYPTS